MKRTRLMAMKNFSPFGFALVGSVLLLGFLPACKSTGVVVTKYVPSSPRASGVTAGSGQKVEQANKVIALVAPPLAKLPEVSAIRDQGGAAQCSAVTFEPRWAVESSGILSTQETFIYETRNLVVDEARFREMSTSAMLASQTLSPDRLAAAGTLTRTVDGGFTTPGGDSMELLQPFPWPPPKASASLVLDNGQCRFGMPGCNSLGEVDKAVVVALAKCGYVERSYYTVPGGYALVTRLEQIRDDGSPIDEQQRWQLSLPGRFDFWSTSFWRSLLVGDRCGKLR